MSLPPSHPPPLARGADTTLTEQLAGRFEERIRQRLLAPGARLPSVRECARRHQVSPHTVVAAYDQLLALGLVEARQQRGFFVRESTPRAAPGQAPSADCVPAHPLPVSATSLIRGMFQPPGARPMPGLGTLPADWLDLPLLAGALRKVTSGAQLGAVSLQYGDPAGEPRLREALASKLRISASAHRRSRSSRPLARPMRSMSSPAPCCAPVTACSSTSRAGPSSTRGWPHSACVCCRCRAPTTAPTWPRCST